MILFPGQSRNVLISSYQWGDKQNVRSDLIPYNLQPGLDGEIFARIFQIKSFDPEKPNLVQGSLSRLQDVRGINQI